MFRKILLFVLCVMFLGAFVAPASYAAQKGCVSKWRPYADNWTQEQPFGEVIVNPRPHTEYREVNLVVMPQFHRCKTAPGITGTAVKPKSIRACWQQKKGPYVGDAFDGVRFKVRFYKPNGSIGVNTPEFKVKDTAKSSNCREYDIPEKYEGWIDWQAKVDGFNRTAHWKVSGVVERQAPLPDESRVHWKNGIYKHKNLDFDFPMGNWRW